MKKKKQCCPTITGGYLLLFVGAIMLFWSCNSDNDKIEWKEKFDSRKSLMLDDDRFCDPSILPWEKWKANHDSLIKTFNVYSAGIRRDPVEAERELLCDTSQILPLYCVYSYFEQGKIFSLSDDIMGYDVVDKIKWYLGFQRHNMATWDTATKKMVRKFSKALSKKDKRAVAKSLIYNAQLIDSLQQLSDADLHNVIRVLDTIVKKQSESVSWLYSSKAMHPLCMEYVLLRRVWKMPMIMKGEKTEECWGEDGYYLGLGKELKGAIYETDCERIWNTRYLNPYQYAIGIVHRRIKDVGVQRAVNIRKVVAKTASVMRDAASLLQ